MKKVSVVVPIYNAESYIKKCVQSLLNQTYKNLEIILLNDGSTDDTDNIIKTFKDKRIKYIKKDNTGIGDTRNLGIDIANGDYIMFIDSDDYIELDCVSKLLTKAEKDKCDLVIADYYIDTNNLIEIKFSNLKDTNLKTDPSLITKVNLGPCNKLYSRELLLNNRFLVGIKYEDAPVVVQALCEAKKIGFVHECLFHYVIKQSGETITRDERIFDIIKVCQIISEKLNNYDYIDKTNLIVKILFYYLKNSRYITDKALRKKFVSKVFEYLNMLDSKWRDVRYLQEEPFIKRTVGSHKFILNMVNFIYDLKRLFV